MTGNVKGLYLLSEKMRSIRWVKYKAVDVVGDDDSHHLYFTLWGKFQEGDYREIIGGG